MWIERDQQVVEAAVVSLMNSALPRRRITATMWMLRVSILLVVTEEEGPSCCCADLSLYWRY
jgi:hypothetical protein